MSAHADSELMERQQLETNIARMREEMLTELSRRHNWEKQEEFWQRQMSNWASQEKYWRWQNWALLGAFVLGALGLVLRAWPFA